MTDEPVRSGGGIAYNDPDCVWDEDHDYGGRIQNCTWTYDAPEFNGMSRFYRIASAILPVR